MALPQINATETTTKPATEEVTFDRWWLRSLNIQSLNNQQGRARATLVKYGYDSQGNQVFSDEQVNIVVPNIWERAGTDADFAQLMADILTETQIIGVEQNKL